MSPLSWETLRTFATCCQAGSFTAAAAVLDVGQATVSRHIATLEDEVGQVLFDRHRDGLTLTAAAQTLLPHAEAMVAEAQAAVSSLEGLEADVTGRVRVALPPGPAVDFAPPVVRWLRERHPGLVVEVLASNRTVDLVQREADIAVRSVRPHHQALVFKRFPDLPLGVFMSPQRAAEVAPDAQPADVPWVQYAEELLHMPIAQWVERQRGTRPAALVSNSFLVLREAVRQGMGAMVLPRVQGELLGLQRVPQLEGDLKDATVPWYLVTLKALRTVPRVRAVMDAFWEVGTRADLASWLRQHAQQGVVDVPQREVPVR